jgi:non-ribosomal peptide synthetase component F
MHAFTMPSQLAQSLKELARREGATLFMVLLAGLFALLHRYTGQDDLIIGTLSPSGRKQSALQRCMGYFLNPVALRANVSGNPSVRSLLAQMREVTLGAISNDDVPLGMIADRLQLKPDPSRHPFFTVALSVAPDVAALPPGWGMTYMDVESGGARWDLYIEMSDRAEGLLGRAQYNPDLFTPATMAETIEDFQHLLEKIATTQQW